MSGPVLEELRITGLGVIEDTTLPFTRGMNVITGETGAGKTMVVTGLGLLFGGRADAGRVRADPGRATVEGRLRLNADTAKAVAARVIDAGAEPDDDGTLLLSRTVTIEGRSRAHVGGRSVPVSPAVRGGGAGRRRSRPVRPAPAAASGRAARLARPVRGPDHEKLLAHFREVYTAWRKAEDDLADRRRNARQRNQEAELLKLGLDEISRVDPQLGEDEELRNEAQRLEHSEGLRTAASIAHRAIGGGAEADAEDAGSMLSTARRTLEAQSTVDTKLGELALRLEEAISLVGDTAVELSAYLASLDADPARLQEIYERRAALRALTRKYADDVDGVIAWADRAKERLTLLDVSDEAMEELDRERQRLATEVAILASAVRAARLAAAAAFAEKVTVELAGLAMPHARIELVVAPRKGAGGEPTLVVDGEECGVGPDGCRRDRDAFDGPPGRPVAAAAARRLRWRALPGHARDRGGLRRCRWPAHTRLRRGGLGCRRHGGGGDRPAPGAPGPQPPGPRRHPPAPGGCLRRPAPRRLQGHQRRLHHQRRAGRRGGPAGT